MKGRIIRPKEGTMLPEVGRLRIGKKTEKGYPTSVDWFIATGKYADLFTKTLGEPNTIQIIFYSDDATEVCNERYEYRDDAGALVASGDGELFKVWTGKEYEEFSVTEHPQLLERILKRYPTKRGQDNWDIVLTMRFVIPAVRGVVGVWQFSTKGQASSIKNIRQSFDAVQQMRGTVTQTVFDLSVQFVKSNKPNSKSRYPVVSLVANDNRISEVKEMLQPSNKLIEK